MIVLVFALAALAAAPRGEVLGGWAGNANGGYGYLSAQQSLAQNDEAGVFVRGGTSHLHYRYFDGAERVDVDSPGLSLGAGFRIGPGPVSVSLTASYEVRSTTRRLESAAADSTLESGGSLATSVFWEPQRRMALFAVGSFSGANAYLWGRVGAMHQVVPKLRRDTAYALWFGLDGTARGNPDARAVEAGAVAELRSRDLHGSLSVRSGLTFEDVGDRVIRQGTVGIAAYWSY